MSASEREIGTPASRAREIAKQARIIQEDLDDPMLGGLAIEIEASAEMIEARSGGSHGDV